MMFCKSCGHEIDNDSTFCSFCGFRQSEYHKPEQVDIPSAAQPPNENVEFSALLNPPLVVSQTLEIKANNQSLSNDNFLEDIDLIIKSLRRPETVKISVFLQVVLIIYNLYSIVWGMTQNTAAGSQVLILLIFSVWRGLLANGIFHRRNRAKRTFCVLFSLSTGFTIFMVLLDPHVNLIVKTESFGIVLINFIACIILFSKTATKWFYANKENIV
jgi:hypothetical protein